MLATSFHALVNNPLPPPRPRSGTLVRERSVRHSAALIRVNDLRRSLAVAAAPCPDDAAIGAVSCASLSLLGPIIKLTKNRSTPWPEYV